MWSSLKLTVSSWFGEGGFYNVSWAWRNPPVTTPINVESDTTTLSCVKGILTAFIHAAGVDEHQHSPFRRPVLCVPELQLWVLPEQDAKQMIWLQGRNVTENQKETKNVQSAPRLVDFKAYFFLISVFLIICIVTRKRWKSRVMITERKTAKYRQKTIRKAMHCSISFTFSSRKELLLLF